MKFSYEVPPLVKQLMELKSKSTKIYFGFPKGNSHAEIAKSMSVGYDGELEFELNGKTVVLPDGYPARPFLTDGFRASETLIQAKVKEYWEDFFIRGISSTNLIGDFIVQQVKSFVMDNPYQSGIGAQKLPQQHLKGLSSKTGKMAEASVTQAKGKAHPLVNTGSMINSMSWVVTNPKNIKKENEKVKE